MSRIKDRLAVCWLAAVLLTVSSPVNGSEQLLVSGFSSDSVALYDGQSGAFVRVFRDVLGPQASRIGPDGNLYLAEENRNRILRFDGSTGVFIGAFVRNIPGTEEDETGGLRGPTGLTFDASGDLYVASFNTDSVLKYDGSTGEFLEEFVASGSGGLNGPDTGTTFGPDGNLYVPSFFGDRISRYDGQTGAFIDHFVPFQSGALRRPRTLIFHDDGLLYVTGATSVRVHRYDAVTGAFVDNFVGFGEGGLLSPVGMAFGPDGNLYVSDTTLHRVLRFDGMTGDFIGNFTSSRSGGVDAPTWLTFVPEFKMALAPPDPGLAGAVNRIDVTGATSGSPVLFGFSTTSGQVSLPNCPGVVVDLGAGQRGGRVIADPDGLASLLRFAPSRLSGRTVFIQAVELGTCRVSNQVEHTFP